MSMEKTKKLFRTEDDRKKWIDSIRKSVEHELQRQVRDALGTPPKEKLQQRIDEIRRQKEIERNRAKQALVLTQPKNVTFDEDIDSNSSDDYESFLKKKHKILGKFHPRRRVRSSLGEHFDESLLDDEEEDETDLTETSSSTDILPDHYNGYAKEALKATSSTSNICSIFKRAWISTWIDKSGNKHTIPGPFWPAEVFPLYPTQQHIYFVPDFVEPLNTEDDNVNTKIVSEHPQYRRVWRGSQIVFDSNRRSRGQMPHEVPPGCPPTLVFESRFESGNLRQARRIGDYEYELVLKTDLNTQRHTQWFYFRVQKAVPGVTYKFNLINLLKKDSLYNYGMKPLLYSEVEAESNNSGWKRVGHHIIYQRNSLRGNPLLKPELIYYTLTFHLEFSHANDTCYLAHCYPYTYTDLEQYLRSLADDPMTEQICKKEVMCKTLAGNNCYVLTVTSPVVSNLHKLGVVVTARVHPGETNASWMMKGLLDFITSQDPVAQTLRKKFVFKIVPMLNPDGVIVGNYRTNLAARDLNRTYKNPNKQCYPTTYFTKQMLQSFSDKQEVVIYCDLHGHSRKPNVFMYGCTTDKSISQVKEFLQQRLFPWMMSKKAPDKFSFRGCKFQVRRCKESTSRVVMWKQMGIMNSFTMEATFCGTEQDEGRHFHVGDFQAMGKHFCEVLLEYSEASQYKINVESNFVTPSYVELVCRMTEDIVNQMHEDSPIKKKILMSLMAEEEKENRTETDKKVDEEQENQQNINNSYQKMDSEKRRELFEEVQRQTTCTEEEKQRNISSFDFTDIKQVNFVDVELQSSGSRTNDQNSHVGNVQVSMKSVSVNSYEECVNLLTHLSINKYLEESDSSDSDSDPESEPVLRYTRSSEDTGTKRKKKKKKNKKMMSSTTTPTIGKCVKDSKESEEEKPGEGNTNGMKSSGQKTQDAQNELANLNLRPFRGFSHGHVIIHEPKKVKLNYTKFVDRYSTRSGGGIPIFSQERQRERARKKELQQKEEDKTNYAYSQETEEEPMTVVVNTGTSNYMSHKRRLAYYILSQKNNNRNASVLPVGNDTTRLPVDFENYHFDTSDSGGDSYGFTVRVPKKGYPHQQTYTELEGAEYPSNEMVTNFSTPLSNDFVSYRDYQNKLKESVHSDSLDPFTYNPVNHRVMKREKFKAGRSWSHEHEKHIEETTERLRRFSDDNLQDAASTHQRIPDQQRAHDQQRILDQQRTYDQQRILDQQRTHDQRILDQHRSLDQRIFDQQRTRDQRLPDHQRTSEFQRTFNQNITEDVRAPDHQRIHHHQRSYNLSNTTNHQRTSDHHRLPDHQLAQQRTFDRQRTLDHRGTNALVSLRSGVSHGNVSSKQGVSDKFPDRLRAQHDLAQAHGQVGAVRKFR